MRASSTPALYMPAQPRCGCADVGRVQARGPLEARGPQKVYTGVTLPTHLPDQSCEKFRCFRRGRVTAGRGPRTMRTYDEASAAFDHWMNGFHTVRAKHQSADLHDSLPKGAVLTVVYHEAVDVFRNLRQFTITGSPPLRPWRKRIPRLPRSGTPRGKRGCRLALPCTCGAIRSRRPAAFRAVQRCAHRLDTILRGDCPEWGCGTDRWSCLSRRQSPAR